MARSLVNGPEEYSPQGGEQRSEGGDGSMEWVVQEDQEGTKKPLQIFGPSS